MRDGQKWRTVTPQQPCPVCGHRDRCKRGADGRVFCWRDPSPPAGWQRVKAGRSGGALFRPAGADGRVAQSTRSTARGGDSARPSIDWGSEHERCRAALTAERRDALAAQLGVAAAALDAIGAGWASADDLKRWRAGFAGDSENPTSACSFPERDGNGRIVGLSLRAPDGRKGSPRSAKRGLIVPSKLATRADPVVIVEGASDCAALETLCLACVGRPSNAGGADDLAAMLDGHEIIVCGERDQKSDGSWPGRDGAKLVARRLASERGEPVRWALPPESHKDVRAWLEARVACGLDLGDEAACSVAGQELLAALQAAAREAKPEKRPPQSELLVRLALERYRIGLAVGDEPFAVPLDGPNVALMFRGSRDALRSVLSRECRRRYRTTPNASALADALTALQGAAHECAPEPVHLRLAEHDDAIVLDLGRVDGRCVVIRPGGWELADVSSVLFRRTALTAKLPEPQRGGSVELLRELLNVSDDTWPLVLGWLVAAFLPSIPHPILMLGGEQGAGKSCAARYLVGLFDPSTAELRSQPSEPEQWALAAAGSWGVAIDNVSFITVWWSDALCKAVTGDGWVRRRLWTDGELSVVSFRRVIVLNSIDAGALRGDLGDRLLLADLDDIDDARRRSETELDALYAERRPLILGALLDLVAAVLARLPGVKLRGLPRMADFARVLAAMAHAVGSKALTIYAGQRGRIAGDVIESEPVGAALVALVESYGEWNGTSAELLTRITPGAPEKLPHGWPKSARMLAGRVRRLVAPLRAVGVEVVVPRPTDKSRRYCVRRTAQTARPPENGPGGIGRGPSNWAVHGPRLPDRPADRPDENGVGGRNNADSGRLGGPGGCPPTFSGAGPARDGGYPADESVPVQVLADCPEACGVAREEFEL